MKKAISVCRFLEIAGSYMRSFSYQYAMIDGGPSWSERPFQMPLDDSAKDGTRKLLPPYNAFYNIIISKFYYKIASKFLAKT